MGLYPRGGDDDDDVPAPQLDLDAPPPHAAPNPPPRAEDVVLPSLVRVRQRVVRGLVFVEPRRRVRGLVHVGMVLQRGFAERSLYLLRVRGLRDAEEGVVVRLPPGHRARRGRRAAAAAAAGRLTLADETRRAAARERRTRGALDLDGDDVDAARVVATGTRGRRGGSRRAS